MRNIKRFFCILAALSAVWGASAKKAKKAKSIDKAKAAAPVVDMAQEAAELQVKADAGDAAAQRELGIHYYYGWGVARDLPMAASLFKQAAEQGDAIGQRWFGQCYERGEGVSRDTSLAYQWWRRAAEQGDGIAQLWVGSCYAEGYGVEQNKENGDMWQSKGIETLTMEAEQGDNEARTVLGSCYIHGDIVRQNGSKGIKLWRIAAKEGYAPAMNSLGWYRVKHATSMASIQQGVKCFKQAAEWGDMVAQYNLGQLYTDPSGLAIRTDRKKGIEYYTLSAEQEYAEAQYKLGLCYRDGNGVEKDIGKAFDWLRAVAQQGHKKAQAAYDNLLKE